MDVIESNESIAIKGAITPGVRVSCVNKSPIQVLDGIAWQSLEDLYGFKKLSKNKRVTEVDQAV